VPELIPEALSDPSWCATDDPPPSWPEAPPAWPDVADTRGELGDCVLACAHPPSAHPLSTRRPAAEPRGDHGGPDRCRMAALRDWVGLPGGHHLAPQCELAESNRGAPARTGPAGGRSRRPQVLDVGRSGERLGMFLDEDWRCGDA
jgi:hypothetical protein